LTAASAPITAIFAVGSAIVASGSNPGPAIGVQPGAVGLAHHDTDLGYGRLGDRVIILAPCRMMPCFSTAEPTMKPGTSERNSSGTLNASQSWTNRVALSAESTNSTPPLNIELLPTTPTTSPSAGRSRPSAPGPQRLDLEERALVDDALDVARMSKACRSLAGTSAARSTWPARLGRGGGAASWTAGRTGSADDVERVRSVLQRKCPTPDSAQCTARRPSPRAWSSRR
jgi:hypothetical protein